MKIDVLGCGSAFSCTQNTSALRVIDADNKQWLIDCGPTVPRALWQRGGEVNDIDAIYFTHVHPDHCTGRAGELAAGGPWFHHRLAGMPRSLDVAGLADPHCPHPA